MSKRYCNEEMQKAPSLLELIKKADIDSAIKEAEAQTDEVCNVLDGG